MNIDEARKSIGKRVVCFEEDLQDKELWISEVDQTNNSCLVWLSDITGCLHDVQPSDIELFPNQKISTLSVKLDTNEVKDTLNKVEIRKEIAFLLIQNNYAIDGNFKYMVDKVVHAIGEME